MGAIYGASVPTRRPRQGGCEIEGAGCPDGGLLCKTTAPADRLSRLSRCRKRAPGFGQARRRCLEPADAPLPKRIGPKEHRLCTACGSGLITARSDIDQRTTTAVSIAANALRHDLRRN